VGVRLLSGFFFFFFFSPGLTVYPNTVCSFPGRFFRAPFPLVLNFPPFLPPFHSSPVMLGTDIKNPLFSIWAPPCMFRAAENANFFFLFLIPRHVLLLFYIFSHHLNSAWTPCSIFTGFRPPLIFLCALFFTISPPPSLKLWGRVGRSVPRPFCPPDFVVVFLSLFTRLRRPPPPHFVPDKLFF